MAAPCICNANARMAIKCNFIVTDEREPVSVYPWDRSELGKGRWFHYGLQYRQRKRIEDSGHSSLFVTSSDFQQSHASA
jgi:hypothetical protein